MRSPVLCGVLAVAVAGCAETSNPTDLDPLVVPVFVQSVAEDATVFRTHASGSEEVPANDSKAQGQATFKLSEDGTELHYKLIVANIENVQQAHIHRERAGASGGVVVWLYPSGPPATLIPGRSNGILAEGVITDDDVIGSLAGTGVEGLLAEIRAQNTYVNVHTTQYPPGEIRGQIH
jgi:hypothetical protein